MRLSCVSVAVAFVFVIVALTPTLRLTEMYHVGIITRSPSLVELGAVSRDDGVIDLGTALWAVAEACCCSEYATHVFDRQLCCALSENSCVAMVALPGNFFGASEVKGLIYRSRATVALRVTRQHPSPHLPHIALDSHSA